MKWDEGDGESNAFPPRLLLDRGRKPHVPARLSSPVSREWLAWAQEHPCDLSHPDFPGVLRV